MEESKVSKKNKAIVWNIIIVIIALILVVGVFVFVNALSLKADATQLKSTLIATVDAAKSGDMITVESCMDTLNEETDNMVAKLDTPLWKIVSKVPLVGGDVSSASALVNVLDDALDELVPQALSVIKEYPINSINKDAGFDVKSILGYIDLLDSVAPKLNGYADRLKGVSFRFVNLGDYSKYITTLSDLSDKYDSLKDYLDFAKMFLGDGSDRFYLLAAQNSAEIRASGGFPGSIGSLVIKDGLLTVGDFKPVNSVLLRNNPASAQATSTELQLFSFWVNYPRDFDYCPNFERVGYNWAESYMGQEEVDGVISLAPTIIQSILSYVDQSITLSDGTVLDGTNATKILQYDLYYKYLTADESAINHNTDSMVDGLFAETAQQTMDLFFSSFNFAKANDLLNVFDEGIKNRTIMMWMRDKDSQQLVKDLGCSGGLGDNLEKPVAGVYFSCSVSSKLGWFFNLNTQIDDCRMNKDGSKTYDLTVTLLNSVTDEDLKGAGTYILGSTRGTIVGNLHLFAPMGGTIDNVKLSNGLSPRFGEYENLKLAYIMDLSLPKDKPVKITYSVTTSKYAKEDLVIQSTPTLQEYH